LVVHVTPACPAAPQAEARFTSVLAATARESGEVRVDIQPHVDGFVLSFLAALPEGQTERELTDPDCAALLSASVLLAAIALDVPIEAVDLSALEASPPPESSSTGAPAPEAAPPEVATPHGQPDVPVDGPPPSADPLPGAAARLQVYAHASLGLASPLLPALRPDGGVGLGLYLPGRRASLGVVGSFRWTGPQADSAPVGGVRVRARALGADLGLCGQRAHTAWALDACAGGRLWRVRGEGVGSDADLRAHASDIALWANLGVTLFAHERLGVRATLGVATNLQRARLNVTGLGALHTAPAFQVEGSLALWVRLGP
jgi:hypothetical protein